MYAFGLNSHGQLGLGHLQSTVNFPTVVELTPRAGDSDYDSNNHDQYSDNASLACTAVPGRCLSETEYGVDEPEAVWVVQVECGSRHSLALCRGGQVCFITCPRVFCNLPPIVIDCFLFVGYSVPFSDFPS